MALGGFHQITLEETLQIAKKHSVSYAQERYSELDSRRMSYLLHRNTQELEMVVQELREEQHSRLVNVAMVQEQSPLFNKHSWAQCNLNLCVPNVMAKEKLSLKNVLHVQGKV